MTLFHYEEDLQYFQETAKTAPKERKEKCENAVRLLAEAHEIYVATKKQMAKS
jgi:hypothetical protein